jgi:hypothetical protein
MNYQVITMKNYYKAIASVMVTFSLLVTAFAAPVSTVVATTQFESQSGFTNETTFDFDYDFTFNTTDSLSGNSVYTTNSGEWVSMTNDSFTECALEASSNMVTIGESITLSWKATGFDTITVDGQFVSDSTGTKTISNLQESTTFVLEALNSSGAKCFQTVHVTCLPDPTPIRCEDYGYDFGVAKYEWNGSHYVPEYVRSGYVVNVTGNTSLAHWTATPAVAGVIGKAGTVTANLTGGTSGSVSKTAIGTGKHDISYIEFCGKHVPPPTQPTPPECPLVPAVNRTIVDFNGLKLRTDKDLASAQTSLQSVNLQPGTYDITLVGWDGYNGRENVSQPKERYQVSLFSGSTEVAKSGSTDDLKDTVREAINTKKVNTGLVVGQTVTAIRAVHPDFPDSTSPNSLYPICAAFDYTPPTSVERFATVVAEKIVCTDKNELPKFGTGGPDITAQTAADWVATHESCNFVSGWEFQWTDNQTNDPGDTFVGKADSPWKTFGPTNSSGRTATKINLDALTNDRVWFREVLQEGYIPFTHSTGNKTESAEFYCHTDVVNYDNREFIKGMQASTTYHCVAWNVPVQAVSAPSCDLFTAQPSTITRGDSATLAWKTTNAVEAYINQGVGQVALNGSTVVTPLADIVYELKVIGLEHQTATCTVPVTVTERPLPVCESFTATPNALATGGGSVTLDWVLRNATTATITPMVGAVAPTGSKSVSVTESTTFTLIGSNEYGDEASCTAPVTVAGVEPVFTCADNVSFAASRSSITRGQSTVLTWNTTAVDTVSISGINSTALSGSQTVSPSSNTTYVLTATQGTKSIDCPVAVRVSSGGSGGGGGSTPRCELTISDSRIKVGELIELVWTTSGATEVTLSDDRGMVLLTTGDYLANDKREHLNSSIIVRPTRDTRYTLLAERGSADRECFVEVRVDSPVVVLETRDQAPLVAGIALSQVPYTGFEAGPIMTLLFYVLLVAWSLYITYLLVVRKRLAGNSFTDEHIVATPGEQAMAHAEMVRPDAFVAKAQIAPTPQAVLPQNLPTGAPVVGYENQPTEPVVNVNPHQVNDVVVTELENRAHAQQALLSSDAIRYFIGTTSGTVERTAMLDSIIAEAKKTYPLEDGWVVLNEMRMKNLCEVCQENQMTSSKQPFVPATVPEGAGSLAEAIVTGNIVAAYQMIGNRPMFALADAAADLDGVYRTRQGGSAKVSDLLMRETATLTDEQLKNAIVALTGALDGVYTSEEEAVKMAIMKAVKAVA